LYCTFTAVLILSLFITSNYIINSFYTNQFLFLIEGSIIILIVGFLSFKKTDIAIPKITLYSTILVALWISYILLNEYFINTDGEKTKSTYLIVGLILYVAFTFIFLEYKNVAKYTFAFISILAAMECIYCILQFFGVIQINDSSIKVTGSWVNPNITAMFLALILPFVLLNALNKLIKYRKLVIILLVLIVVSLILLKCRTAILGALLATALVLEWHHKICQNFIRKSSKKSILATVFLLVLLITSVGYFTYYVKKDSADGRKLIWSLSSKMIAEKPLFGYGFGNFERNYNLEQANYFSKDLGTDSEKMNASHTEMAYNEIIENTVEGGLLGGAFFVVFVALLLKNSWKYIINNKHLMKDVSNSINQQTSNEILEIQIVISSIISIVVLLFMSLVNFTITAIPIMCVFILYAAIISTNSFATKNRVTFSKYSIRFLSSTMLIVGLVYFYKNCNFAFSQAKITTAINLAREKEYDSALQILNTISIENQNNENFLQTLGSLKYALGKKEEALSTFQNGIAVYSTPLLYELMGDCFFAQKNYTRAIENFNIAKNIQPNRFTPLYFLFRLYASIKDKENTVKYANAIIEMNEKVPSTKTKNIKKVATDYLAKLKTTNDNKIN
jgi:O-antigen polymerase